MTHAAAALQRVRAFGAHAAVVFGSGLAGLPRDAEVEAEIPYEELGWPCTDVPGHANVLRLAVVPLATGSEAAGPRARLRLALACGRPHRYEGWSSLELERPVTALASAGLRRVVLTNSCGALREPLAAGDIVACTHVVDLQATPSGVEPQQLQVCTPAQAVAVAAAVEAVAASVAGTPSTGMSTSTGRYVAVIGPQFETPAEVAWLAGYGDVVGMSAAPEMRAARAAGAASCLLGLVANWAAAVGSHEDVLAVGAVLADVLAAALPAAVLARWPELTEQTTQGASWTS